MTRIEKYKHKRKQMYDKKYDFRSDLEELKHLCAVGSRVNIIKKINSICKEYIDEE